MNKRIKVESTNMNPELLCLHPVTTTTATDLDTLIVDDQNQSTLCINEAIRYRQLIETFGNQTKALYDPNQGARNIDISLVRCAPIQYTGMTFQTNNTYRLTQDNRVFGRKSIEGARVALIGGIDCSQFDQADIELRMKINWEKYILTETKELREGRRLVLALVREDAEKFGRAGLISGIIQQMS